MLREVAEGLQRESDLRTRICHFLHPSLLSRDTLPTNIEDSAFLKARQQGHAVLSGLLIAYQAMWLSSPHLNADRVTILFEVLSSDMAGF